MVSIVESQRVKIDRLLWVLVFVLIVAGIAGYYYFANQSLLIRILGIVALTAIAIAIAFQTKQGKGFWEQCQASVQEVRKMVWPTRQETMQTTLAVMAMVVVMGILLWTTDFVLLRLIGWVTGHWRT